MSGPKVLIVDDEPQIRRFLRASLQAHDYQVIEAENGKEGVRACTVQKPDLLILDLGLPDMDGLDADADEAFVAAHLDIVQREFDYVFDGVPRTAESDEMLLREVPRLVLSKREPWGRDRRWPRNCR